MGLACGARVAVFVGWALAVSSGCSGRTEPDGEPWDAGDEGSHIVDAASGQDAARADASAADHESPTTSVDATGADAVFVDARDTRADGALDVALDAGVRDVGNVDASETDRLDASGTLDAF